MSNPIQSWDLATSPDRLKARRSKQGRLVLLAVLTVLTLAWGSAPAQAQFGGFGGPQTDPFSAFYGFFLPRQQALANQPSINRQLNEIAIQRQRRIPTINRDEFGDPFDSFGLEALDRELLMEADPYASRERRTPVLDPTGPASLNTNGRGPLGYFDNSTRYFPNRVQYSNPDISGGEGFGGGRGRGVRGGSFPGVGRGFGS
ncbi:hypothetical protein Isop_3623 [Isosphaera pallida ATCC 43644]|uniref:Uncharacterized protein n=1 Tax=Isosphaera pallida (strain ATCC 43644 / DSM 9630 / IS1B) TaxID=575540 RepID=E8QYJ7_ISOPI|nr:hypothetical protein [Isosphaera pallida]ADV64180.1 hypothetical protein Isop_3623 [Isosphaera pallida ATCC 43644]